MVLCDDGVCLPLGANEWLFLKQHWKKDVGTKTRMLAMITTTLKKSELNSQVLPKNETMPIVEGTELNLRGGLVSADDLYWIGVLA